MYTIHETILSYMILSENTKQVGYPLLNEAANISWYTLFKKTKESIVRKWIDVKSGVADYPCSVENVLGLMVVDSCGDLVPLFEDNVKNILPKPAKKCTCNSCDNAECLCPTIQDTIVSSDVVIDGETYTNKIHTRVLKSGKIVEQRFEWIAKYGPDSEFIEAVLVPSETTKCELDTKSCGCPLDTAENAAKLYSCGCVIETCAPSLREHYPALENGVGYYKLDEENRQVYLFGRSGKKSKLIQVMIVYESNGSDMLIPDYARMCFLALLDWTRKVFSPNFQEGDRISAKKFYLRQKDEMLRYLNPIPFEWFVRVNDPFVARNKNPYYLQPHSDFVDHSAPAVCLPPAIKETIINNTNITQYGTKPLVGVVDEGGEDDPVSGQSLFQSNKLIGLGAANGGRIKIEIDDVTMANYGQNASFSFNMATGEINLNYNGNGFEWMPGSSLYINLNQ